MAKSGPGGSGRMRNQSRVTGTGQHPSLASGVRPGTGAEPGARSTRPDRTQSMDGGRGRGRGRGASRGMGLRNKFMLVLAGVTAVVLVVLGIAMAMTSNRFLFAIKRHAGVEVARMVAQVGIAVDNELKARMENQPATEHAELRRLADLRLTNQLTTACTWGKGLEDISDIYSIRFFDAGEFLTAKGFGEQDSGATIITRFSQLLVAKSGTTISLPREIEVYEASANINGTRKPIYRFSIALGGDYGPNARVRVDIASESVHRVSSNLFMIMAIAVIIAIAVVVAVANYLAGNITKPIDLLMRDMRMVAGGNLDHQTRPHSDDEIGVLATEFNRMTNHLAQAQSALVEQEKAEYELSLAREVQRQLLPAEVPQIPGFDAAAFYQGAKAVSGDYFDFIPLGNGLMGFIVADVSGKGIPGSMVMAVTRTIVRLVANKHQHNAAETLKETNRLIAKQIKRGMFVTAFYAILDEATATVHYASAGHNPMVVYRAATKSYELANAKGIAIGFNEGPIFDKTVQQAQLKLSAGDTFVVYTDGFPEAMNAANEEFGDERFYECVAKNGAQSARSMVQALLQEIAAHRGQAEQSDDLTIIAVRRTP